LVTKQYDVLDIHVEQHDSDFARRARPRLKTVVEAHGYLQLQSMVVSSPQGRLGVALLVTGVHSAGACDVYTARDEGCAVNKLRFVSRYFLLLFSAGSRGAQTRPVLGVSAVEY